MGPSNSGSNDSSGSMSKFRNEVRMQKLLHAFRRGDRVAMEEHISSRAENSKLHRKLRGKDAVWEELKEGVVYKVVTEGEAVVAKFFDDYPFHEICGNVVGTSLLGQVAFGVEQLRRTAGLQHFDLRYDNIMVKVLPEPKDLFKNGILSSFVIKIGDFGQCEFDFPPHPTSSSASSSSSSAAKAIAVPPPTPPPPAAAAVAAVGSKRKQSAQDRPTQITTRMPVDVLRFLKDEVAPTL
ncbi:protein catalytic domain protein [Nannochloropsis oceanica]